MTTRRTTSKGSKGILGCATATAYKPLVHSVCEPGLKSLFWVRSCQALVCTLLACLKSHCLLGQDFILSSLCQSSLFYLTLFTLWLSLFQGHVGCWSFTLTPGTQIEGGMYGWAVSTTDSSPIFHLNCAPAQSQWLSVVQRGFMKGTRNPLRFPCLPSDDLDVMIFFIRF